MLTAKKPSDADLDYADTELRYLAANYDVLEELEIQRVLKEADESSGGFHYVPCF